jgi:hypothetical protein
MLYRSVRSPPETWLDALARSVERSLCLDFGLRSALLCATVYAACAAIFLWPGAFFTAVFLNDAFIYVDAGYRLTFGQAPGLATTSALGVFAFIPYALAFHFSGNAIEAIPLSFVIFGGVVFGLASIIALTRLSTVVGTIVVFSCSLVMLAPYVIGHEVAGEVMTTAAMSYNRFGFLLVLLTALLTIEPRSPRTRAWRSIDLAWATTATMLAYYTKMPFGLGVAGLVCFWLVVMRRDVPGTLIFVAGCVLVSLGFEAVWPGLNAAYIHEMNFAAHANGGAFIGAALIGAMTHTTSEILAIALAPLAGLFLVQRADWRDGLFALLLLCGSFLLLSQSSQGMVLATPVAIAVIAVMRLASVDATEPQRVSLWIGMIAVFAGFALLVVPAAASLVRHERYATRAAAISGMPFNYRSLRVIDDSDIPALDAAFTGSLTGAEGFAAARTRDQRFTLNALRENEYAHTIAKLPGARDLCGDERERTAVLDFANVSASLFGHPPAGAWSYLHWGRSFSATSFVPAARMFAGVGCLFDPKLPQNPGAHDGIWTVYGDYLRTHYRLAGETPFWRVLVIEPAFGRAGTAR